MAIKIQDINKSINKGIDFFAKNQHKDGSFLVLIGSGAKNFQEAREYRAIFSTTLILQILNNLKENSKIKIIKKRAADFLLSQKSEHWTFNYWARQAKEFKAMPYPDDLDDTACALTALFQYNPKIIDGSAMGKFVMILTALEEKEGGPYRTWLVKPMADEVWKDIDLAVNSNIAYFLSLQDIIIPNLALFIEQAIKTKKFYSPYYTSPYSIIYFISRFYKGSRIKEIIDFLFSHQGKKGEWNNSLDTAFTVSALLNLGVAPEKIAKSIAFIQKNQVKGYWQPCPFYFQVKRGKSKRDCSLGLPSERENVPQTFWRGLMPRQKYGVHIDVKNSCAGSSALTTAFCLEALSKFKIQNEKCLLRQRQPASLKRKRGERVKAGKTTMQNAKIINTKEKNEENEIYQKIIKISKQRFDALGDDLKEQSLSALEATLRSDRNKQIVLLPYFFKIALGKNAKNISDDLLIQLGLANLYGWIAYTIYDDFLDEEGKPEFLSVANVFLRELTIIFNSVLPCECGFSKFFKQTMDALDAANIWEVKHCRIDAADKQLKIPKTLPDYGDYAKLAERSFGYALGPIAILFLLGYSEKSLEMKKLAAFFKHYIIARQLNDDAHDWEEDLKKGHIDSVGTLVLKKWKDITPSNKQHKADILKIMPDLQKIFWYEIIPEICQTVLKRVELAEKSLRAIPLVSGPSIMANLLAPVRYSAQKALTERDETIKFLKSYNS